MRLSKNWLIGFLAASVILNLLAVGFMAALYSKREELQLIACLARNGALSEPPELRSLFRSQLEKNKSELQEALRALLASRSQMFNLLKKRPVNSAALNGKRQEVQQRTARIMGLLQDATVEAVRALPDEEVHLVKSNPELLQSCFPR